MQSTRTTQTKQGITINLMDSPDNTPMWVAIVVTLASTLGLRELVSQWMKQRGYNSKSDHEKIHQLEQENRKLQAELAEVKSELAEIKGIVKAWAAATDDNTLKEMVIQALES